MSKNDQISKREQAKTDGFTVVNPAPDVLLLDLDSDAQEAQYNAMLPFVAAYLEGTKERERWRSKSGKHWHVVVQLPFGIDMASRIALQAALGSDPKREILSIALLHSPSCLFRPQEAK